MHIGFISTRISGTDGVSLEIEKWTTVLERRGYPCFFLAGQCDRPAERTRLVPEAHFEHPAIQEITRHCFGRRRRPPSITSRVEEIKNHLKKSVYDFVRDFDIRLIIVENALAIPMNIPLGLALTEFIAETSFPTLAHHHDFFWERDRFLVNGVNDYLSSSFPPDLPSIRHVVINSLASQQLSHRKGISNVIIPNVFDFERPAPCDDYHRDLREKIGLGKEDLFILQPTRLVPRKWIERAIEIVYHLKLPRPTLVLSHPSGDEGDSYQQMIREYAAHLGVRLLHVDHLIRPQRGVNDRGEKLYSIADVYLCADLVTYPSGYEGFGNAFLEAVYFRRPIVVNRYSIYIVDIEPKGFDVISIDGFVTASTTEQIRRVLEDPQRRRQMVEKNYRLGQKYFSYRVLEELLLPLVRLQAG